MKLTKQQAADIESIISDYIDNESDIINHAFNYELSEEEVRWRCERWNRVIQIGGWNRMQHLYTEEEIVELMKKVSRV